jgi:hypothetical protein
MKPPTAFLRDDFDKPSPILTSARHQPLSVEDLLSILRAAEAARVLRSALQAAGLERVAAAVTTARSAPTVWLMPLEPTEARELAAFIDRSQLALRG